MAAQLLDHLVYATPDLHASVERFAAATGVRPLEGGRHDVWATRNYLVGLGGTAYLEFLGPDPEAGKPPAFDFEALGGDRLITWAIHPADLEAALAAAAAAGADLGEIYPMSRANATGDLLSWRVTGADPRPYDGVVPFLIDWQDSPHPTTTLPVVELLDFRATHPRPAEVLAVLQALGADLPVTEGPVGLTARIRGPEGEFGLD